MHHQIMGYMVELVSQYILQLISSSISYSTIYDIQDNYAFESDENVALRDTLGGVLLCST